jgi:hypothetical protein
MNAMEDKFIVIMCGSRTWRDALPVYFEAKRLKARYGLRLLVRHGDEPNGGDKLIFQACEDLSVCHIEYCAAPPRHREHARFQVVRASDWTKDGKAAGPIRNRAMRDAGAQGLVAFRMPGISRGTDGMIALAREAGMPVIIRGTDPAAQG